MIFVNTNTIYTPFSFEPELYSTFIDSAGSLFEPDSLIIVNIKTNFCIYVASIINYFACQNDFWTISYFGMHYHNENNFQFKFFGNGIDYTFLATQHLFDFVKLYRNRFAYL